MSGAPICSGTRKLARPKAMGTAKRNIMMLPCMVKSWLKVDCDTRSCPGWASSARMSRASAPPTRKNPKEQTM